MKTIDKKTICLLFIAIILFGILFLLLSFGDKNIKWDKFKLDNLENSIFAIMIQQDDGTYQESLNALWPGDGYKYNSSISGCVDVDGEMIPGALKYDPKTNVAEVKTEYTSYCYLYFDQPATNLYDMCKSYNSIDECLKEESSNLKFINDIWDSSLADDGYRYIGTYPDNYVCFGTTDKDTCIENTDQYMYRIIGIFQDSVGGYHLKLIKKEALNTAYAWHSTTTEDANWDTTDLYKGINGTYFLNNTTFSYMQNSKWLSKITEWNYTTTNTLNENTGISYYYNNPSVVYLHELNLDNKTEQTCYSASNVTTNCGIGEWDIATSTIGLMYVSDYMLSLGESILQYTNATNASLFKTGWLHIENNDSEGLSTTKINPPSNSEWTLARYGIFGGTSSAYNINSSGNVNFGYVNRTLSVRPVFYLNSSVKISGGTGTQTEPYLIG